MARLITMILNVVKVWNLRFVLKYSSVGYMPICGVNKRLLIDIEKSDFLVSQKFAPHKRHFLRETVIDSNTNCTRSPNRLSTMLPESSSRLLPAKRPSHAT